MLSLTETIEIAAVVTGAVYGVLLARRHGMDFVGVFSVSFMTAFGGGTLRDVLLDRHPLFWIRFEHYPVLVFIVCAITSLIRRTPGWLHKSLNLPDALGLGLFSVAGTQAALDCGTSGFVAIIFGVITGTFGGVIGDIVCNEIPSLFRPHTPLYATCAFTGGLVYVTAIGLQVPAEVASAVSISMIVLLRLIALKWNICLPGM